MSVKTYIVCYPKSGGTWLRVLLGKYFQLHYGINCSPRLLVYIDKLPELNSSVPFVKLTHDHPKDEREQHNWNGTPNQIPTDKSFYADANVIFLTRDPRDIVVSAYYQKKFRHKKGQYSHFEGTIREFVYASRGNIHCIIRWYNIWNENKHVPKKYMRVKYEDMQDDITSQMIRVLRFIGVDVNLKCLKEAIEFCSFDNMRKLEKADFFKARPMQAESLKNVNSYKVRSGKVGSHKQELEPEEISHLDEIIKNDLDSSYGY